MEKRIKQICTVPDNILELLQKDIAEIKVALLGNEYNPHAGLLYRTTELEKEVEVLRSKLEVQSNKFNRIVWTGIGVGTAVGFMWSIASAFIDKFILMAK